MTDVSKLIHTITGDTIINHVKGLFLDDSFLIAIHIPTYAYPLYQMKLEKVNSFGIELLITING